MTVRSDGITTRQKILEATVKLFLNNGFHQTTTREICAEAGVSLSSFNNAYRSKEGVLLELVGFMFQGQFAKARRISGTTASPVTVYAVETAIQLAMTDLRSTLRDIYVEAYTLNSTSELIYKNTAMELYKIFSQYNPGLNQGDFYELEIASGSVMRGYMAIPSNPYFPLEKKIRRLLEVNFAIYNIPPQERAAALEYVDKMDIRAAALQLLKGLMTAIAEKFGSCELLDEK